MSFVCVEPFFDFAVGLWVFGSTTYVLCSLLLEVLFELAAVQEAWMVAGELTSLVCEYLFEPAVFLAGLFDKLDGGFYRRIISLYDA